MRGSLEPHAFFQADDDHAASGPCSSATLNDVKSVFLGRNELAHLCFFSLRFRPFAPVKYILFECFSRSSPGPHLLRAPVLCGAVASFKNFPIEQHSALFPCRWTPRAAFPWLSPTPSGFAFPPFFLAHTLSSGPREPSHPGRPYGLV